MGEYIERHEQDICAYRQRYQSLAPRAREHIEYVLQCLPGNFGGLRHNRQGGQDDIRVGQRNEEQYVEAHGIRQRTSDRRYEHGIVSVAVVEGWLDGMDELDI